MISNVVSLISVSSEKTVSVSRLVWEARSTEYLNQSHFPDLSCWVKSYAEMGLEYFGKRSDYEKFALRYRAKEVYSYLMTSLHSDTGNGKS